MVTWVMVPAGILLVLSQLLRSHQSLASVLRGSVAGVGAMVPEGLVLLTSIAFAVGAIRLAGRRVLVQELAAIEGPGGDPPIRSRPQAVDAAGVGRCCSARPMMIVMIPAGEGRRIVRSARAWQGRAGGPPGL
jgi:hypothetical protein